MKRLSSEGSKVVNDRREEEHNTSKNKARILIIDGYPAVRRGLTQIINQQAELGVWAEAQSAEHALDTARKQQVDLAIVDISLEGKSSVQLVEKVKSRYPNIPVLILKMHDEVFYVEDPSRVTKQECIVNEQVAEQIIKAVRYVQALLRSKIFGFTVLVEVERRG
ncbi:MAG: response regulator [Planctomycetota bacterium]|jgi:DNA-binding NarL/FixJ family response regulator